MSAPGPCEWCQDEPAEPVHRRSAPKLCAECREDGVERCSFCRRLWVPHTEAEEEAAADGTCPNCVGRL